MFELSASRAATVAYQLIIHFDIDFSGSDARRYVNGLSQYVSTANCANAEHILKYVLG